MKLPSFTRPGNLIRLTLAVICLPMSQAYAQNSQGASGGTLMTAALEAAGYKAQSLVLTQLVGLLHGYSVLLFVAAAILGLSAAVLSKNFEIIGWLLVGAPLFFFAVFTVSVSKPPTWRFGNANYEATELTTPVVGRDEPVEVSWLFHKFNDFITRSFQEVVRVITSEDSKTVMTKFMSREQILKNLLQTRINDGGLFTFATESLALCNDELDAARTMALGERDAQFKSTAEYKLASRKMSSTYTQNSKQLQQEASYVYLEQLLANTLTARNNTVYQTCITRTNALLQAGESQGLGLSRIVRAPISCEMLWCWMGLGFENQISGVLQEQQVALGLSDANFQAVKEDIAEKLTQAPYIADARDPTGRTPYRGVTPVTPDVSVIPVVIGGYLVRSLMQGTDIHASALSHFAERAGIEMPRFSTDLKIDESEQQLRIRYGLQEQVSKNKQVEIFGFAMTLPYVQGIILYGLALSFPFFCLLLLIPGKAHSFLIFPLLWAWVKSWDIGFALVMLLEEFLWELMPHSSYYDPIKDPTHGPVSIFEAAFRGDPAYMTGNYFVIVAALIAAIPILTAQVFIGRHASLANTLVSGLRSFAQQLGAGMRIYTAAKQLSKYDSMRENFVASETAKRLNINDPANIADQRIRDMMNGPLKRLQNLSKALDLYPDANLNSDKFISAMTGSQSSTLNTPQDLMRFMGNPGAASTTVLKTKDAKLFVDRLTNSYMATLTRANAAFAYFKAYDTQEYSALNNIRAGLSGRNEHWNFPDNPSGVLKDLELNLMNQMYETSKLIANRETAPTTAVR